MRAWAFVAAVLLVSPALAAPPDIIGQVNWLWAPKPKASPTVPVPVPAPQSKAKPETAPAKPAESRVAPRSEAAPEVRKPRPRAAPERTKPASKVRPALSGGGRVLPPAVGITCEQARQGVGMPCFLIRANAYRYEQLSLVQKRQADNCLTVAEREAIRACFR